MSRVPGQAINYQNPAWSVQGHLLCLAEVHSLKAPWIFLHFAVQAPMNIRRQCRCYHCASLTDKHMMRERAAEGGYVRTRQWGLFSSLGSFRHRQELQLWL